MRWLENLKEIEKLPKIERKKKEGRKQKKKTEKTREENRKRAIYFFVLKRIIIPFFVNPAIYSYPH